MKKRKSCYTCKHRKLNDGKYYCNKSKELLIFNYEHEAELYSCYGR